MIPQIKGPNYRGFNINNTAPSDVTRVNNPRLATSNLVINNSNYLGKVRALRLARSTGKPVNYTVRGNFKRWGNDKVDNLGLTERLETAYPDNYTSEPSALFNLGYNNQPISDYNNTLNELEKSRLEYYNRQNTDANIVDAVLSPVSKVTELLGGKRNVYTLTADFLPYMLTGGWGSVARGASKLAIKDAAKNAVGYFTRGASREGTKIAGDVIPKSSNLFGNRASAITNGLLLGTGTAAANDNSGNITSTLFWVEPILGALGGYAASRVIGIPNYIINRRSTKNFSDAVTRYNLLKPSPQKDALGRLIINSSNVRDFGKDITTDAAKIQELEKLKEIENWTRPTTKQIVLHGSLVPTKLTWVPTLFGAGMGLYHNMSKGNQQQTTKINNENLDQALDNN